MISKALPTVQPTLLQAYLAWVDAWLLESENNQPASKAVLTLDEVVKLFKDENLQSLLNNDTLRQSIRSFKHHLANGDILFGGTSAPSCDLTNLLSENYNPKSNCNCHHDQHPSTPKTTTTTATILHRQTTCAAIRNMTTSMTTVLNCQAEWHADLFTPSKLTKAVNELILSTTNIQTPPSTCLGPGAASNIPPVHAPDRRPNPGVDGTSTIIHQLYPTAEQLKICTDAKYFGVIACGAGVCDEGLARAIADSCNDILIGDYCEAADDAGLRLLQRVGSAAVAFLKLCTLGGRVSGWSFDNLVAYMIQCRVLGYYRDHQRAYLPDGVYGSYVTGLGVHRHIDVAAFHGVMTASVATGLTMGEGEYMKLVEGCVYVNDLVDFRGDAMRKQRENVILRGVRGNLCGYLDLMISRCLQAVVQIVEGSELGALVVMGYCNWAVMGSHHKVYEIVKGVRAVEEYEMCRYECECESGVDGWYGRLLKGLKPFGTLGCDGPSVYKKRVEMDKTYSVCRSDSVAHLAWLADVTRSLLEPCVLRRMVDVVHYQWIGDLGDRDYCP